MIFTYQEIEAMSTLHQGHFANLKYDDGRYRIWLSRCSIEDGEFDPIQVEEFKDGCWVDVTRGPDRVYLVQGQGMRAGVGDWTMGRDGEIKPRERKR